MLEAIEKWIRNHIFNEHSCCYMEMEYKGIATMLCCNGKEERLCETCPYFVKMRKGEEKC